MQIEIVWTVVEEIIAFAVISALEPTTDGEVLIFEKRVRSVVCRITVASCARLLWKIVSILLGVGCVANQERPGKAEGKFKLSCEATHELNLRIS